MRITLVFLLLLLRLNMAMAQSEPQSVFVMSCPNQTQVRIGINKSLLQFELIQKKIGSSVEISKPILTVTGELLIQKPTQFLLKLKTKNLVLQKTKEGDYELLGLFENQPDAVCYGIEFD